MELLPYYVPLKDIVVRHSGLLPSLRQRDHYSYGFPLLHTCPGSFYYDNCGGQTLILMQNDTNKVIIIFVRILSLPVPLLMLRIYIGHSFHTYGAWRKVLPSAHAFIFCLFCLFNFIKYSG